MIDIWTDMCLFFNMIMEKEFEDNCVETTDAEPGENITIM